MTTLNTRFIVQALVLAALAMGLSSCRLWHNENDWEMNPGASRHHTPKEIATLSQHKQ
jgi:hypothetical protein